MLNMNVNGTRSRGRRKRRWIDSVTEDLREKGLMDHELGDRALWKELIKSVYPV